MDPKELERWDGAMRQQHHSKQYCERYFRHVGIGKLGEDELMRRCRQRQTCPRLQQPTHEWEWAMIGDDGALKDGGVQCCYDAGGWEVSSKLSHCQQDAMLHSQEGYLSPK